MKGFLKLAGALGFFAAVVWFERRRPLRIEKESKTRRTARNLAVAGLGALAIHFMESPVLYPLAKVVQRKRLGLLQVSPTLAKMSEAGFLMYDGWWVLSHYGRNLRLEEFLHG